MKENRGLSSSEQYIKKSNRRLLFGGLFLLLVFIVALAFVSSGNRYQEPVSTIPFDDVITPGAPSTIETVDVFARGNAELKVVPDKIDMNNVVIGSQVEAIINLTAENTPIIYQGADFIENQQDGFTFETTCEENKSIAVGEGCVIKVLWNPVSLRQIQNILTINWKEDSQTSFENKKTTVQVKAQSTDSKDCVICETVTKEELIKEQKYAMGPDGKLYPVNDDGSIEIDGVLIKPTENGLYIKDGKIVAVVTPDKLPLNLNNEIMGKISPNGDVIAQDGTKLGRLLGDDTIVDSNLKVLGAAVPIVSVMDLNGAIIGKMLPDGTVVDAKEAVIGKPLANGTIVDLSNRTIGVLRPWGLVANLEGHVIGAIIPDGSIIDVDNNVIGHVKPNGLAVNPVNELLGGTIPMGTVVAPGCQSVGKVLPNGEIRDSYDQTVGRVLIDGVAINPDGADLGTVIPMSLVINEKGTVVGFVNSEGKAVGPKGTVIGCINTDGSVSAGKKTVGAVLQKGRIIGYGCQKIGSVFPDGTAINDSGAEIGRVMPDAYVKNSDNKIIGVVVPRASAIADGCRLLGIVSATGEISDTNNTFIGCMTPEKTIINKDGQNIGALAIKGIVTDNSGAIIGRMRLDGKVMDLTGKLIGCVQEDGTVISFTGDILGKVGNSIILDKNGNPTDWVIKDGKVYDKDGNLIGTIDENGIIRDKNGNIIGYAPGYGKSGIYDKDGNAKNWTIKDGKVYDENGNLIGTIDENGIIRDKDGNIIGYASNYAAGDEIGRVISGYPNGKNTGLILDENGNPTGWSILGNKVYDANGNEIGTIDAEGIVSAANGKFLGIVPPDGIIFSADGLILGRYSSKTGYGINQEGERFARILPDLTAISGETNQIIGTLIPNNTSFMDTDNNYLATMSVDGTLKNKDGEIIGAIRANGTVTDKDGKIIGYQIPQGKVLSYKGEELGTVLQNGSIVSSKKTVIGRVLANGLALSAKNNVIGGVFKRLAVAFSGEELLGYPNISGGILDNNGNIIGQANPFGIVISEDGVIGRMLPFGTYVNRQNTLVGWTSFDADLTGPTGSNIGRLVSNGLALDKTGAQIGYIVKKGAVVDANGRVIGHMSIDNTLQSDKIKGAVYGSEYVYNTMDEVVARILPTGIAVDVEGNFAGYAQTKTGNIHFKDKEFGAVWSDNRIINKKGEIVGTYIPLSSVGFNDSNDKTYLINTDGKVVSATGQVKGSVIAPKTVVNDGQLIAKLTEQDLFVAENTSAKVASLSTVNGTILQVGKQKPTGSLMMNDYATNLTKQVYGTTLTSGAAVSNSLSIIGKETINGSVLLRGKIEATSAGTRALFNSKNELRGLILPTTTTIGKTGLLLGQSIGSASISNKDGKNIAVQMHFGHALSQDNLWAGGNIPFGMTVDDHGNTLGTIATDGAVIGKSGVMVGRVLSDGAVADIEDRELFNVMPYKGGVVPQGLAFSYRGKVLGRTTYAGDILDTSDAKSFRILDTGHILGNDEPVVGTILPFLTATSQEGEFMGTLSSKAQVVSPEGAVQGSIAANGAVKKSEYKILGALVPNTLITNDCKVVGQVSFNGQVINAKGTVVGKILPDKWAVSPAGTRIGRVTLPGIIISPDPENKYIGRNLSDSTVVDTSGVNIGCARNDGTVVDSTGQVIGKLVHRGPIVNEKGEIIGYVDSKGKVINKNGEEIGKVLSTGEAVDLEGNRIGYVVSPTEELLFDEKGNIKGTFATDGTFRDAKTGKVAFKVNPDGTIEDANGNVFATLDENGEFRALNGEKIPGGELTLLLDKDGNIFGMVSGCDVVNPQNEKIGSISADGTVVDLNGNIFAIIKGNGIIYDKENNEMGRVSGTDIRLDRCGIKSVDDDALANSLSSRMSGSGVAAEGIFIGNKKYGVTEDGSIVDDNGIIIGYMENGRPYTLDNRPLTASGDSHGRIRPNIIERKLKPSPEQVQQMQEILSQKRESMKAGMQSRGVITPNKRIQAMGRKKTDANWDSIGINKIVSSYPVDMSRMILKDKPIPAVLTRSIDSRYATVPVTAIVERHIYSEKGRNIIIPAGSRLIGTFAGEQGSDKRVAKLEITWERLIRPDGSAFTFAATSGDAQGRGGVSAYLDDQLVEKFGKPIMTSVVTSAISYMMATNDDMYQDTYGNTITSSKTEAANDARENFINSMQTIFDQLVQDAANIPVVIFVPSGTRLTVFANEDLWLRSEEEDIEEAGAAPTTAEKPSSDSWVETRQTKSSPEAEEETETEEAEDESEPEIELEPSTEEKYYKPVEKEETETEENKKESDSDPVYKGSTTEKKSLKERKVTPVLPKTGSSDKLF